jgi:hypothetical protein
MSTTTPQPAWRKATASGATNCLEVAQSAPDPNGVLIRHSLYPDFPRWPHRR